MLPDCEIIEPYQSIAHGAPQAEWVALLPSISSLRSQLALEARRQRHGDSFKPVASTGQALYAWLPELPIIYA